MSHYSTVTVKIQQARKSAIQKALVAMGYHSSSIKMYDTPHAMTDRYGRASTDAHIIVEGTGGYGYGRERIGIKFAADGQAVITLGGEDLRSRDWEQRFLQQYAKAVVREVAEEQNFVVEEETVDAKTGELQMVVTSQW